MCYPPKGRFPLGTVVLPSLHERINLPEVPAGSERLNECERLGFRTPTKEIVLRYGERLTARPFWANHHHSIVKARYAIPISAMRDSFNKAGYAFAFSLRRDSSPPTSGRGVLAPFL